MVAPLTNEDLYTVHSGGATDKRRLVYSTLWWRHRQRLVYSTLWCGATDQQRLVYSTLWWRHRPTKTCIQYTLVASQTNKDLYCIQYTLVAPQTKKHLYTVHSGGFTDQQRLVYSTLWWRHKQRLVYSTLWWCHRPTKTCIQYTLVVTLTNKDLYTVHSGGDTDQQKLVYSTLWWRDRPTKTCIQYTLVASQTKTCIQYTLVASQTNKDLYTVHAGGATDQQRLVYSTLWWRHWQTKTCIQYTLVGRHRPRKICVQNSWWLVYIEHVASPSSPDTLVASQTNKDLYTVHSGGFTDQQRLVYSTLWWRHRPTKTCVQYTLVVTQTNKDLYTELMVTGVHTARS